MAKGAGWGLGRSPFWFLTVYNTGSRGAQWLRAQTGELEGPEFRLGLLLLHSVILGQWLNISEMLVSLSVNWGSEHCPVDAAGGRSPGITRAEPRRRVWAQDGSGPSAAVVIVTAHASARARRQALASASLYVINSSGPQQRDS